MEKPILYIVIPCYNEEQVLPVTAPLFLKELMMLIQKEKIADSSRILFVNDGSQDKTWELICQLSHQNPHYIGIAQSRNRGHQNAVLAGLLEAKDRCDITISIDCDGQDDIRVMENMVDEWYHGAEIVYGVRENRETDTMFKRMSAEGFYRLLSWMGVESVFNHADYRLVSSRVLQEFARFEEVNLFLRGMFPLVGFHSTSVYYKRSERMAGESHYPLKKMVALAIDGITSLSIKPIRLITLIGLFVSLVSFAGVIYALLRHWIGATISGWTSTVCVICFIGGVQLLSIGVVGEYVGKIYMETKKRPRYIISERTEAENTSERAAERGTEE